MIFAVVFDGRAVEFAVQDAVALAHRVRDDHARVRVALAFARGHHNTRGRLFLRLVGEEDAALRRVDAVVDLHQNVVGDGLQGSADGGVVERVVSQLYFCPHCGRGNEGEGGRQRSEQAQAQHSVRLRTSLRMCSSEHACFVFVYVWHVSLSSSIAHDNQASCKALKKSQIASWLFPARELHE